MWIPKTKTTSGIARNPDFIIGSGKKKTALLVHGTYWHRHEDRFLAEVQDYLHAGWNLFILWTKQIANWMLPSIKREVKLWLAACSTSGRPVLHQFMTWNATLTTTS
jgi:G:T-mismatch repair DNA endonuclease (very short patch repair protein)